VSEIRKSFLVEVNDSWFFCEKTAKNITGDILRR
jgi:hypothetical protein